MLQGEVRSDGHFAPRRTLNRLVHGWVIILLMMAIGCVPATRAVRTPGSGDDRPLIVFAASSLTNAVDELAASFATMHSGVQVLANYASSSTLATQLTEGAQADVFASANQRQMDTVRTAGRVRGEAPIFAANKLVIVTPAKDHETVRSLVDLARPGLRLVLALPGVPARDYAQVVLENAAKSPDYGSDFTQRVLANLVSEEQNVRQVTAKIELGEADAAVVYMSDLVGQSLETLRAVEIPSALNVTALYPIAVIADSQQPARAKAFVEFVLSPEGRAILARWGLLPPPEA